MPENVRFYLVGGYVRDTLMGRQSKDIDFAVTAPSFTAMIETISTRGGKIYLERPEYLTVRARMLWEPTGIEMDADFVLCRKDGHYSDGRRPDTVEMGTLEDDLARRDFTVNAIALGEDGTFYDPHGGRADIESRTLRCVGKAHLRFREDALRLIRALRFSVTHSFALSQDIIDCLCKSELIALLKNVSDERIKDELEKMMRADTSATLDRLAWFAHLKNTIFSKSVWLMPTMRAR